MMTVAGLEDLKAANGTVSHRIVLLKAAKTICNITAVGIMQPLPPQKPTIHCCYGKQKEQLEDTEDRTILGLCSIPNLPNSYT